jgi:hypothetical protein
MTDQEKKLMEEALDSFEWDKIYEVYKVFGYGVGEGSENIPGLKRIPASKITQDDVRKELELIIRVSIDEDIPEFNYGNWTLYWINSTWNFEIEDENGDPLDSIDVDSQLEVHFIPVRAWVIDKSEKNLDTKINIEKIEELLEDAIANENYELAIKLREQIKKLKGKG